MKLIISTICIILILLGCEKENNKVNTVNDQSILDKYINNPPITIHASNTIDIRASDVYTNHNSIKKKNRVYKQTIQGDLRYFYN